jgi:hypothetical protein
MSIAPIKIFIKTSGDYVTSKDESINYIKDMLFLPLKIDLSANSDLLYELNRTKSSIINIFTSKSNVNELINLVTTQLKRNNLEKDTLEKDKIETIKKYTKYTNLLKERNTLLQNKTFKNEQFKNEQFKNEQLKLEIKHLDIILNQLTKDITKIDKNIFKLEEKEKIIELNNQNLSKLSQKEIIDRNIEFLKNSLFKTNTIFNINDKKYIITSSDFIPIIKLFKYYTSDNYIEQQNNYTLAHEVIKQTTYIVFIKLNLTNYKKVQYKKLIQLKGDDINNNNKYNTSTFLKLNCEDKSLFLESQANELEIPFNIHSIFNNTNMNITDNNNDDDNVEYFVKDYVIQKKYPMKSSKQLENEFNIVNSKAEEYNEKHENEITQQAYNNRKKIKEQKKRESDEKREKSERYIENQRQYRQPYYNQYGDYRNTYRGGTKKKRYVLKKNKRLLKKRNQTRKRK